MYGHVCMNIQYGSRCFGADDIPGLHLGYPQMPYCCIRGRKLSNTGILILYAKSLLTRNALTQPEHLRNGCCLVML